MPDKETFTERLRKLRKKAGLNQEELAEQVGVHINTVSRWENGIDTPKTLKIKKLASALHVSEDELLNGVPEQSAWVLHVEIGNNKEDFIDMKNSCKPESVIITSPDGGYIKLGGAYQLWADDALFKKIITDLKRFREVVIANGRALGGIKE